MFRHVSVVLTKSIISMPITNLPFNICEEIKTIVEKNINRKNKRFSSLNRDRETSGFVRSWV
jgi:hypothetical protein